MSLPCFPVILGGSSNTASKFAEEAGPSQASSFATAATLPSALAVLRFSSVKAPGIVISGLARSFTLLPLTQLTHLSGVRWEGISSGDFF